MSISPRALLIGTAIGTVLQTAMVVVGHSNRSISKLFAIGGMSLSLVAGVIHAALARGGTTGSVVMGLGTLSSAVTGAIGGWLGSRFLT